MFFLYFYLLLYDFLYFCMSQKMYVTKMYVTKSSHPEHQFEYATPAIPDITRNTL